ncbi:MAG: hypothetical protein PVG78_19455 [Desulfobacterales bacterium]|jgi:hypothetical protein
MAVAENPQVRNFGAISCSFSGESQQREMPGRPRRTGISRLWKSEKRLSEGGLDAPECHADPLVGRPDSRLQNPAAQPPFIKSRSDFILTRTKRFLI